MRPSACSFTELDADQREAMEERAAIIEHDGRVSRTKADASSLAEIGGGHDARNGTTTKAIVTRLADVRARPIDWLWFGWIPHGTITLLDGDPGLGKSTISIDLAARVSRGWRMPPETGADKDPQGVLMLSAEDDLARTIRPRLDAAGADVKRVHHLDAIRMGDESRPPVLPWDLTHLEEMIREQAIALVVVDPLMAYLGEIDSHKDQDIRRCMHALKTIAERQHIAIVIVRHLNKLNHSVALYRGGGSIGIIGAVRSAMLVGRHPQQPDVRVLASSKSNLAARPRSLLYTLVPDGDVARIGWGEECDLTADEILGPAAGKRRQTKTGQCAEAIREALVAPMPSEELEEMLEAIGYSEATIRRAKKEERVRCRRVGFGAEGRWMASLPTDHARAGDRAP